MTSNETKATDHENYKLPIKVLNIGFYLISIQKASGLNGGRKIISIKCCTIKSFDLFFSQFCPIFCWSRLSVLAETVFSFQEFSQPAKLAVLNCSASLAGFIVLGNNNTVGRDKQFWYNFLLSIGTS